MCAVEQEYTNGVETHDEFHAHAHAHYEYSYDYCLAQR
jgi:hypothetical protein